MTATITRITRKLTGPPATYYDRDYDPTKTGTLHTYGPITDQQVRAFAAQQHNADPGQFDIHRPTAA